MILWAAAAMFCGGSRGNTPVADPAEDSRPRIIVVPAPGTSVDLSRNPARLYASGAENGQNPPRMVIRVTGLEAGATVYWAFEYKPGPQNPAGRLERNPFSERPGHPFDPWLDTSVTNRGGESEVWFTATTYAGDAFRIAASVKLYTAGFDGESNMAIRFRNAVARSNSMEVWKRLFHEPPKVLRNVRYSQAMWDRVAANLENLHIELVGPRQPIAVSPADATISHYFYTRAGDTERGLGRDPRYGPHGYGTRERMLSRINRLFNDGDPATVNVFLLGAPSQNRDLIRNTAEGKPGPPQPVVHSHDYGDRELDLGEWSAFGTGLSLAGESPAIFIWADFWWLAADILRVPYEKALARVFLHEAGHHLLMFRRGERDGILDETGHISPILSHGRTMMTGSSIRQINRRGKVELSLESIRLERAFIENPVWHPRIEFLIRREYRPPERGAR
jgi:hypothetical protein